MTDALTIALIVLGLACVLAAGVSALTIALIVLGLACVLAAVAVWGIIIFGDVAPDVDDNQHFGDGQ